MGDRVILHSDINCCYASIEHLHHPELAGKPLAVGGDPEARHGIVLTADYIAKKYGVKTGMALWQAKQVCPDITFVSPRMDLYLRFSRMAHEIYAEYTDKQEPYGIDECWLDVTGSSSLKGDGLLIAQEISKRMKSELGITVSVGVSFNKIFLLTTHVPVKGALIAVLFLTVSELWEIPVALFLSERFGMIVNLFVCLFITVSGVVISQTRIWYVLVSAIPMRMMCPLLHVLPNGLAAEAGNPLLDTGVIVPGMCLSIIWFVFVTVLFLKWFERREVK